jgi:hypothetical protein
VAIKKEPMDDDDDERKSFALVCVGVTIPASKSFNESTLIINTKQRVLVYS